MPSEPALKPRPGPTPRVETSTDGSGDDPSPDEPFAETTDELSLDVVFDLLSARRRRLVLHYLVDESSTATLGDLAIHLAAIENDKPVDAVTAAERKRVYIALYQGHLPKMDDMGVIDYDSDRGDIELTPLADELLEYLPRDGADPATTDHSRYALGFALLGGALLVAQQTLYPSTWLSGAIVGALVAVVTLLAVDAYRRTEPFP